MTTPGLRLTEDGGAVVFAVRIAPRASRNQVLGVHGDALKIALTAPPVEGAANEALVKLLAKLLGVARSSIEILRGEQSRDKILRVRGTTPSAVRSLVP